MKSAFRLPGTQRWLPWAAIRTLVVAQLAMFDLAD